jgi:hypothetical protein
MELFIPSVLLVLLAAAVVFVVLPRLGPTVLAVAAMGLLAYGVYNHMKTFGNEYRLSTWQLDYMAFVPYLLVGLVLFIITFYLLSMSPFGGASTAPPVPEVPTVAEMPPANTATNAVTAGVNNALKGLSNTAAAVGLGNATKSANNKGILAPVAGAANAVANTAASAVSGITNAITGAANAITGNNKKNNGGLAGALGLGGNTRTNNKGMRIPGLNFPLSQV